MSFYLSLQRVMAAAGGVETVRAMRVVEWVDARVQVAALERRCARRDNETQWTSDFGARGHSASAVLIFDVPEEWSWQPSTAQTTQADTSVGGGTSCVRGSWSDRSCAMPADYVPTLEQVIGSHANWSGTYQVDSHSAAHLNNILSHLDACPARMLSGADMEGLRREMQGVPESSMFAPSSSVATAEVEGSRGHTPCAQDNMGPAQRKLDLPIAGGDEGTRTCLPLQTIADHIELHSGIEQAPQGVLFKLCYRFKLPSAAARHEHANHAAGAYSKPGPALPTRNPTYLLGVVSCN